MAARGKETLTHARLLEVLSYNLRTGMFRRRIAWPNNMRAGSIAGRITTNGRRQIGIDGHRYQAAKLAWFYVTGEWPENEIDHKNCRVDDDRFVNLRKATRSQNMGNTRRFKTNTSGFKGVSWHKRSGRWHARIHDTGKGGSRFLGQFLSKREAAAAYAKAAAEQFGEFARLV